MAKLDEKMATIEAKVHELCCEKDINFDSIINKQDEYALAERRKKQFAKVISELFP